jgi:hypothetical protein
MAPSLLTVLAKSVSSKSGIAVAVTGPIMASRPFYYQDRRHRDLFDVFWIDPCARRKPSFASATPRTASRSKLKSQFQSLGS